VLRQPVGDGPRADEEPDLAAGTGRLSGGRRPGQIGGAATRQTPVMRVYAVQRGGTPARRTARPKQRRALGPPALAVHFFGLVAPIVVGGGEHAGQSSGCGIVDGSGYDGRVGASVRLITRRSQVHLLRPRRPITT
jgi:hypothetical protein